MFQSIVVGTDGSPTASEAVRQAAELARGLGARVHLVSAYAPLSSVRVKGAGDAPESADWRVSADMNVERILDDAASGLRGAGVDVESHAQRGDPADAIIRVAEDENADLIIVGNKGMTGAKRFLLGSVPDKISHHAPCSVMIVRTT
ncbi:MAG TPA: universal stress protein [Solirubrobacteraceae bacterium]|jgi:nucleotide-binding universal stress UspA family protein